MTQDPAAHDARVELLRLLKAREYSFVTPTPTTHERVLAHPGKQAAGDLRDVFGWSLPFEAEVLGADLLAVLERTGGLVRQPAGLRSAWRVSALGGDLFLHSAFPTDAADAVFFGPDTYRFARLLVQHLAGTTAGIALDIGCGSGAGAVAAARAAAVTGLVLSDVNPRALELARVNLEAAGIEAQFRLASGLEGAPEGCDLVIANPPYMAGQGGRTYRDGRDMHGAKLSLDWTLQACGHLAPGGRMVLYTGVAIIDGQDLLRVALEQGLGPQYRMDYQEIDPDVFGEMLDAEAYQDADRIAVIGAVIDRLRF